MKKKTVLWATSVSLLQSVSKGSGSWLFAMRDLLSDKIDLYNLCLGNSPDCTKNENYGICEYQLSEQFVLDKDKGPLYANIKKIIDEVHPDIIHIWGTESVWASVFPHVDINVRIILEIQGLLTSCACVYWAGLAPQEIRECRSFWGFFIPSLSLNKGYKQLQKKGDKEREIIRQYSIISTQSDWTRRQLLAYGAGDNNCIYQTLRPIRDTFYNSPLWKSHHRSDVIIFSSFSYIVPFKGLHMILKMMGVLVKQYPNIHLRLAGNSFSGGRYFVDGYTKYLRRIIRDEGLENNIVFLGRLNAEQLANNLLDCDVFINPSFVESFSASAVEALSLGVPSLLAYSGAMPGFSEKVRVAEYYNPLDYFDAAAKTLELVNNKEKAESLGGNASAYIRDLCAPGSVCKCQLDIYSNVLGEIGNETI